MLPLARGLWRQPHRPRVGRAGVLPNRAQEGRGAVCTLDPALTLASPFRRCEGSRRRCWACWTHRRLLELIRRVSCFGLTLVKLDLRQESDRHTETLDAITQFLGLGSYQAWSEEERQVRHALQSRRDRTDWKLPSQAQPTVAVVVVAVAVAPPCRHSWCASSRTCGPYCHPPSRSRTTTRACTRSCRRSAWPRRQARTRWGPTSSPWPTPRPTCWRWNCCRRRWAHRHCEAPEGDAGPCLSPPEVPTGGRGQFF